MKLIVKINLLVLFFFSQSIFANQSIYVKKLSNNFIDSEVAATIYELIKVSVVNSPGFDLSKSESRSDFVLSPKILKLGNSYILNINKKKGDKIIYSQKLKSATLDDMDTVVTRVVRSVLKGETTNKSATVTDITKDEETRGTRRYKVTRQFRFSFGSAWSHNLNADGAATAWSLGYLWGLDHDFDLKLMMSGYSPKNSSNNNSAQFSNISIGMNHFFNRSKTSPFVTTSIGRVSAAVADNRTDNIFSVSSDKAFGWALTLGGGYKFFRTSTVNVGVLLNHTHLFAKTEITSKRPSLTSFNLIIYY